MYVKLIDGTPHIANMPDAEAAAKGFKPAIFTEKPAPETGYHPESSWEETPDSCVQSWHVVPDVDDDSADAEELLFILTGGAG